MARSELDHIVIGCASLDAGMRWVEARLGVAPVPGGRHLAMGTHNALVRLGQRNYIAGSENRIVALMNGQIKATILDFANTNILMQKAGDRFARLPGLDNPASDEILFARTAWIEKNAQKVDLLVEEFVRLWGEMAKNPGIVEQERAKRGLLKGLPKEVVEGTPKFYAAAVKAGVYKTGGSDAAKADLEFYTEAGQLQGPLESLKLEDFWYLAPFDRAAKKLGMKQ